MRSFGIAATGFAAAAVVLAPAANAADAYLGGLMGFVPAYSSMTGPTGQKCNPGATCQRIRWDNISVQSAERNIADWVADHPGTNTIWTVSESTPAVVAYVNAHPEDRNTWILIGSPAKPGNGNTVLAGGGTVTNLTADLTFVSNVKDSVALPGQPGTNFTTHLTGYTNLDMRYPTTSRTIGNTKDNVYSTPKGTANAHTGTDPASTLRSRIQERRAERVERRETRQERRAERRAARTVSHTK